MRFRRSQGDPSTADQIRAAEERLHIYAALVTALEDPHATLDLLMESDDPDTASAALRERYGLDELQAYAVLDLQFRQSTTQQLARLRAECAELTEHLVHLRAQP